MKQKTRHIINHFRRINFLFLLMILPCLILNAQTSNADKISFTLNIRGIYKSDVSLKKFNGFYFKDEINRFENAINFAKLEIPSTELPGYFMLRFDYMQKPGDRPYPVEIPLFLNKSDIIWNINPLYNSADSLKMIGDIENTVYRDFIQQNQVKRQNLGLLEQVLLNYDQSKNSYYKKTIKEFERQKSEYNKWLDEMSEKYTNLFVSHVFKLNRIGKTEWGADKEKTYQSRIDNYFTAFDFNDEQLIKTQDAFQFMNNYIRLFVAEAKNQEQRDSLLIKAGDNACKLASNGHPEVYGFIVNFFYRGFEQFAVDGGVKSLKSHIKNPNCKIENKEKILNRIAQMEQLKTGSEAPDFEINLTNNTDLSFHSYHSGENKYKLLLFWAADCQYCNEFVSKLKEWYNNDTNKEWVDVFAISLDEKNAINKWQRKIATLPNWIHYHPEGDIGSDVAQKYAIKSTPEMFLIDGKTNTIVFQSTDINKLNEFIN